MLVNLPPGVVSEKSRRSNQANWRETHLVRWENATMQPVKGWQQLAYPAFTSPVRAMHRWNDNNGGRLTAYLCETACYVDNGDGTLIDITPDDGIAPPSIIGQGGFGDEFYDTKTFGTERNAVDRLNIATPSYTLDNWGEELRVMTSADGRLLRWDPAAVGTKLVAVENAPINNRSFVVTPERCIIVFGAGGVGQQFVWSDQENDTVWTPGTASKAGGFYVEPAAPIMAHRLTDSGTLMFTSQMGYVIEYIGLPYVYSYRRIGECPPPYSPAAVVNIPQGVFWAALNGFWLYNGVNVAPVSCPVWDWITERINPSISRYKATVVNIATTFEVWFFFTGETVDANFVVIYNYKDQRWSMGELGRNCGISIANDPNPLMATDTKVFRHEEGYVYPGVSSLPWAETFTLNTGGGRNLTTIRQMLPEIDGDRNAVQFRFIKRNDPTNGPEVISVPKMIRDNGYVDVRETARDFRIRVEMINGKDWSLGPSDIDWVSRGSK